MIRALLCDLGNVLLRFDHMKACRGFSALSGLDAETVYERIFGSGIEADYDLGRISSSEFARKISQALGCTSVPSKIQSIWSEIFEPVEGMEETIRSLSTRYRLVLLSNTNPWHFEYCIARFSWLTCFHAHALSFQAGCKKPDPALFQRALPLARVRPEEAVFIDDIQAYVDAAGMLGIKSICFKGADPLKSELRALGMEPAP